MFAPLGRDAQRQLRSGDFEAVMLPHDAKNLREIGQHFDSAVLPSCPRELACLSEAKTDSNKQGWRWPSTIKRR